MSTERIVINDDIVDEFGCAPQAVLDDQFSDSD